MWEEKLGWACEEMVSRPPPNSSLYHICIFITCNLPVSLCRDSQKQSRALLYTTYHPLEEGKKNRPHTGSNCGPQSAIDLLSEIGFKEDINSSAR